MKFIRYITHGKQWIISHKYLTVIFAEMAALSALLIGLMVPYFKERAYTASLYATSSAGTETKQYIKWVDFGISRPALEKAFRYDVDTFQQDIHLNWIELLAYLGAKYGGDFSKYKETDMTSLAEQLMNGAQLADLTQDMKYYSYYLEAYTAVLGGMVGLYEIEIDDPDQEGQTKWVQKYGLKAFSPIAKSFPYQDFDDFGTARSYGFRRQHLGHDMMGQVGTPVIAVESGYVEAMGWNQYGGWRLGIRSFDKKRYYYYAHLRQNYPYQSNLSEGSIVQAGDVIGYLGRTGYSRTENTNNIDEPHLHFGIQLIFDESQKEGNNEIWIDCYQLIQFLSINRSETQKIEGTKEWKRIYQIKDPAAAGQELQHTPGESEVPLPESSDNTASPAKSQDPEQQSHNQDSEISGNSL